MKLGLKIVMIIVLAFTLEGCKIQYDQLLMSEYETLCTSKSTLNKSLCRETMSQLPKFESDINTYFKEKFKIEGFKLTGIHFPYGEINHGGFSATFQLESDPYVMLTDTFDYDKGVYKIRAEINEPSELAGQYVLANGILFSAYYKTLPLEKITQDLERLEIKMSMNKPVCFSYQGGRYLQNKNIISDYFKSTITLSDVEKSEIINNYNVKNKLVTLLDKYKTKISNIATVFAFVDVHDDVEARQKFDTYTKYISEHQEYKLFLEPEMHYYIGSDNIKEKKISMYKEGDIYLEGE